MRKEARDVIMNILKQKVRDNEFNISKLLEKHIKGKLSVSGQEFMSSLAAENVFILEAAEYIYKGEDNGKKIYKVK